MLVEERFDSVDRVFIFHTGATHYSAPFYFVPYGLVGSQDLRNTPTCSVYYERPTDKSIGIPP